LDSFMRGTISPLTVDGDECVVELVGDFDWDVEKHRITVDYIKQFESGDLTFDEPEDEDSGSESRRDLAYCGNFDQIEPANCMTHTHQLSNAKAVVKIVAGGSVCTGFFFGAHNRVLTNHHCIRGFASGSASAEVILYHEASNCVNFFGSSASCNCYANSISKKIDVRALIATYPEQDASLISLDYTDSEEFEHKVLAYYDNLQSQTSPFHVPSVGDQVYIIGHPNGIRKVISRKNDNGDFCKITKVYLNGRFRTNCETAGGSSGSPVFFANGDLLGLHNSGGGGCDDLDTAITTGGYTMKKIWDEMKDSQFKCCGKFHKSSAYDDPLNARRFCDDIPFVWGDYHDQISSLQITSDCKVYAYSDTMMSGDLKVYSGSVAHLGSWNNKISSLRFARTDINDRCWVKFYKDALYGGNPFYFFTQDQPILYNDAWESGDSAFSSFKIASGCRIKIYKGSKYTGHSQLFEFSQPFVGDTFNDQISSFRLFKTGHRCWVRFFKSEGCPQSEEDNGQTWITHDDIRQMGSWNDEAKSMKIRKGCMAQVFEHEDFEGANAVFPFWNSGIYSMYIYHPIHSQSNWQCIEKLDYLGVGGVPSTMESKITSFRLFNKYHRPTRRSLEGETEE